MKKLRVSFLCLCFVLSPFIGAKNAQMSAENELLIDKFNTPPVLDTVTLNKNQIIANCSTNNLSSTSGLDNSQTAEVNAHATDADNDPLVYNYEVAAGRIIRTSDKSSKAIWDLTNAPAGEHFVIIRADDGCGICGNYTTMKIKVVKSAKCGTETSSKK